MDPIVKFLKSALRRASQRWKPIYETRNRARRPYTGKNKNQKYEYQCNICKRHFSYKKVQVDHIIPVGRFSVLDELSGYAQRLLCDHAGLQVVCLGCHQEKTDSQNPNKKVKKPAVRKKRN